jgi:hypothetical protein
MRGETESVTERSERLNAALEDVRRAVAETSEASQRLLEEIQDLPPPYRPPRAQDAMLSLSRRVTDDFLKLRPRAIRES